MSIALGRKLSTVTGVMLVEILVLFVKNLYNTKLIFKNFKLSDFKWCILKNNLHMFLFVLIKKIAINFKIKEKV